MVLAFSGGGARAAAFSLGVLRGLDAMRAQDGAPLSQRIALITAVSGGAITASYYGLHGRDGLDSFRAAYLDKDWPLGPNYFSPRDYWAAFRGGVNGPERLADWLDAEVFAGARMQALDAGGPRIVINATDLYNGAPFAFTPFYFEALCSDLSAVRVADAVAASMAVPLMFRPVLAESHAGACEPDLGWTAGALADAAASETVRNTANAFRVYRDPNQQRYLHLVDGGVTDNFGLSSLMVMRRASGAPYAPLAPDEAARARRIVVLVVNAERRRPLEWQRSAQGPGGGEVVYSALDVAVDAAKRGAYDAFRAMAALWGDEAREWRCALAPEAYAELAGPAAPDCADLSIAVDMIAFDDLDPAMYEALINTETAVTLAPATIDALIAAGEAAVRANALAQSLTRAPGAGD